METPNELVTNYLLARRARDHAQLMLDEAQSRLIKQMEADQRKSFRWKEDGVSRAITYVQKRTTVINEAGLRKALTAKVFDKYTKRVLDRKAMEEAMDTGEVDPVTVLQYVTMKPQRPYLELREKEITTEETT
jgi:hypothetical protein